MIRLMFKRLTKWNSSRLTSFGVGKRHFARCSLPTGWSYSCCSKPISSLQRWIWTYLGLHHMIHYMHHLTCGIAVNLFLFTLLLVHLILRICLHLLSITHYHSPHLRPHHLSLPRLFTPDLKLISFTNPFLHSLPDSIWTGLMDLRLGLDL